ncbi:MAG: ABC transporter permease [Gaiellaceae bacterium]
MNEIFGIPSGAFATATALALAGTLVVVAILALRNRVFVKLGLRNLPRRRSRTILIVVGLMLGTTIIAAALATGDTMSHTVRSQVVTSLGNVDEMVSAQSVSLDNPAAQGGRTATIEENFASTFQVLASDHSTIDGVAPAIIDGVGLQDVTTRQNEPRVGLFATDPAAMRGFGTIQGRNGEVKLGRLGHNQIYINEKAADKLDAQVGDRVNVLVRGRANPFVVRDIVRYDGIGTSGAAVMLPLERAQELLGVPGQIQHILISNRGGALSGVELTDTVTAQLQPSVDSFVLQLDDVKREGLDIANAEGNAFMSLFTTFGSFSIAAGVLLIFLIFVMLAAERRGELGIARAVGTRRSHLVQMYLFEGMAYDLLAAVAGVALGLAVAYGMVYAIAASLGSFGIDILYNVSLRSVVLAYSLGVLLTFIVVTMSAWRVSRLNITAAVRNLPDPAVHKRGKRRWVFAFLGVALGLLLLVSGVNSANGTSFLLGYSITLIALASIARKVGVPERVAYTCAGLGIVVFGLLPLNTFDWIADFSFDYTYFLAGGLVIVVGATWVIVYNAPLLLGGLTWLFGRIKALAPVLKLSIAYPLRSVFRTGVTLAMFMLVVFTLVTGTTISGSFVNAWNDVSVFGGGFDIRGQSSPMSPISNVGAAVERTPGIKRGDIQVAASQSMVALDARQVGTPRAFAAYPVVGFDDAFLSHTTYGFAALARGYTSGRQVWDALRTHPNLAVVDPDVVPRRDNWDFGPLPDFQLSGFYVEDGTFKPVPIEIRDVLTGTRVQLTVVGILADATSDALSGVMTSQRTLAATVGDRAAPTTYWFKVAPGVDAKTTAKALESGFLGNGMDAEPLQETLDDLVSTSKTFNWLIEAFMGLGLVVGVAALGVISARAVVERRQQIGVLRAIGFRRGMIQAAFLLEASFVALTAIVVGTALGLVISYNVVADTAKQPSWDMLSFAVPWTSLAVIFVIVYLVALLTTLAPALRASRVYPAEALRYQ